MLAAAVACGSSATATAIPAATTPSSGSPATGVPVPTAEPTAAPAMLKPYPFDPVEAKRLLDASDYAGEEIAIRSYPRVPGLLKPSAHI